MTDTEKPRYTVRVITPDKPYQSSKAWWCAAEPGAAEIIDTLHPERPFVTMPGVRRTEFLARFLNDVPELLRKAREESVEP